MTWTPERIDILKSEWAKGTYASAIGAKLGISKNAVLGKVRRLKLTPRPEGHGGPFTAGEILMLLHLRDERHLTYSQISAIMGRVNVKGKYYEIKNHPRVLRKLDDLAPLDCRYPYGDKTPYQFCGKPALPGRSYCQQHFELCHKAVQPIEEAA